MKARPLPTEKIFGVANFASTTKISIKFRLYYAGTPACTLDTNKKLGCVRAKGECNRTIPFQNTKNEVKQCDSFAFSTHRMMGKCQTWTPGPRTPSVDYNYNHTVV